MQELSVDVMDVTALAEAEVYFVIVPAIEILAFGCDVAVVVDNLVLEVAVKILSDELRVRHFFVYADDAAVFCADAFFEQCAKDSVCFHFVCEFKSKTCEVAPVIYTANERWARSGCKGGCPPKFLRSLIIFVETLSGFAELGSPNVASLTFAVEMRWT